MNTMENGLNKSEKHGRVDETHRDFSMQIMGKMQQIARKSPPGS
jgi:hypothetical protein